MKVFVFVICFMTLITVSAKADVLSVTMSGEFSGTTEFGTAPVDVSGPFSITYTYDTNYNTVTLGSAEDYFYQYGMQPIAPTISGTIPVDEGCFGSGYCSETYSPTSIDIQQDVAGQGSYGTTLNLTNQGGFLDEYSGSGGELLSYHVDSYSIQDLSITPIPGSMILFASVLGIIFLMHRFKPIRI